MGVIQNLDEKAMWLMGGIVSQIGGNIADPTVHTYRAWRVKSDKGSRFSVNEVCWYKRSVWSFRKSRAEQGVLGALFIGVFTFSKLLFSPECHIIHA